MNNAPYDYEREEAIDRIVESQMQNLEAHESARETLGYELDLYLHNRVPEWRKEQKPNV